MKPRVVCSGIAVLDRVYELAVLPTAPGKVMARGFRETGGGMAATAAVAITALGGAAAWCGRLGADDAGAALRAAFARHDVDTRDALVAQEGRTPTSGVFVDAEGERILAVFPGAGLPETPQFDATLLHGAGAVLADPRWVAGAERLFALALERGLPRVIDAESGAPDLLARLAPQADHVIFSQRGLAEFSGSIEAEAGLAMAAARLSGTLAVTLGAAGSLWWQDGAAHRVPAPRILARDTTGCGDVFHGAYALALAEGAGIARAARFATAAAALKAQRGAGWNGMPDRAAVEAMLREEW
jgi:sulfofructose kinase